MAGTSLFGWFHEGDATPLLEAAMRGGGGSVGRSVETMQLVAASTFDESRAVESVCRSMSSLALVGTKSKQIL